MTKRAVKPKSRKAVQSTKPRSSPEGSSAKKAKPRSLAARAPEPRSPLETSRSKAAKPAGMLVPGNEPRSSPRATRAKTSKSEATHAPAPGHTESDGLPAEATEVHTRILRLALAVEDSRLYWQHLEPGVEPSYRATLAFEQRWFGAKSLDRVRYLVSSFAPRYDAFPSALGVLRHWKAMDLSTGQVLCHWHLQLSDPLYRRFTSELLLERRSLHDPKVDRDAVLRWLKAAFPERWAPSTYVQFANKLLSAALEAGLVSKRDPRALLTPKVSDPALAYLLYLLRETRFAGSLTANPYLASVGIDEELLTQRARALPGVDVRRMMGLVEFEWAHPDLATWARKELP